MEAVSFETASFIGGYSREFVRVFLMQSHYTRISACNAKYVHTRLCSMHSETLP